MDLVDDETRKMPQYLPHELIVSEILVRLPVKSLLRFRCACKAWRDTVSGDTSFSQAHVRRHQRQKRSPSSLLIAPYITILDPDDDMFDSSTTPGLYEWEENQRQDGIVTLVHDMSWSPVKGFLDRRHGFAHCDGLLMLAAPDGTVRVLNPATRRSLTLPLGPNIIKYRHPLFEAENAFGFGRDPSTGAYKVARSFHRNTFTYSFGMEVFTVGEDRCWRETARKPPYPVIEGRTATFFKGFLIWTVHLKSREYHSTHTPGASGFVRLNLKDESFSVMAAPRWYPGADYEDARLAELHGELALARLNKESVKIWICNDVNPPLWTRLHVVNFPSCIHPVAAFDDGIVFRDRSDNLWRQTSEGSKNMVSMKTLKYHNPDTNTLVECSSVTFDGFDVIPYIPSLVSI